MKILLSLLICSQIAGTCMEPYEWPNRFDTQYDCLMFGYEESAKKMKEIGRADPCPLLHDVEFQFLP